MIEPSTAGELLKRFYPHISHTLKDGEEGNPINKWVVISPDAHEEVMMFLRLAGISTDRDGDFILTREEQIYYDTNYFKLIYTVHSRALSLYTLRRVRDNGRKNAQSSSP